MVKRVVLGSLVAAVLASAGCSGGSPAQTPSPSPSTAAEATPSASPAPSLPSLPVTQCLTGSWSLARFVGAGGNTYGTGEGGDVVVAFADGAYTLKGEGKKPIELTLAGNHGTLLVNGTAKGTYKADGTTATFASTGATGDGTVELNGQQQTIPMSQVTTVVGLTGVATKIACTSQTMTVTLQAVRLEFDRV